MIFLSLIIEIDYVKFSKHSTKSFIIKNSIKIIENFYPAGKPTCFVAAHSQYMNTASYAVPRISTCE